MKKIILASASPRRKELMKTLGLDFEIIVSDAEESWPDHPKPEDLAMTHAREKTVDIAGNSENKIIIGADTIVVLDDERLGKPADKDDAFRMLSSLQGKSHRVITGLCIIDTETGKHIENFSSSKINMRPVSKEEIMEYINTGEPMDKAGAYAIQGGAGKFITSIEGSYTNIIGFPLELLAGMLAEFGIEVTLPGPEVMEFRR